MRNRLWIVLLVAIVIPALQIRSQQPVETSVVFSTQIQPILAKNCQVCHQGGAAPADLHLDSAAGVLQGSISGKVIIPGKSSESLLYQRISDKTGVGMPPTARSRDCSDQELD